MPLDSEKKPTLLLVDDDAIIADSLEYVLSEEYRIERASDRISSFELISKMTDSPTLALVDLGLPPNTHLPDEGLAVIRKISQMHPSTRILVLSGQDNKCMTSCLEESLVTGSESSCAITNRISSARSPASASACRKAASPGLRKPMRSEMTMG